MDTRVERLVKTVEPYRAYQSKLIAGVWLIERKLVDIKHVDGTEYTMDYGIKQVLANTVFDKPHRSNSKRVQDEIATLTKLIDAYKLIDTYK